MKFIIQFLNIQLIFLWTLIALPAVAQSTEKNLCNPVLNMRDGAVERYLGYYYAIGEGTKGNIYYSKDLVNWQGPVLSVTTNEANWLNDPQWPNADSYKNIQAGDIIYRNGVFHTYWNGIGHAYSPTPLGPYKEASINEPFDDYGIDVQVFQDEDGSIYWIKKRNASDPDPLTRVPSNLDGPEVWTFKMNSVFSRKDITLGSVQLTHQPGHPTSLNMHNFEGPELFKYRGRYYLLFVSNRMGPRSGMYEIGVAESDQPMNFDNTKKYPHPVLTRNTEQHLMDYKIILHSAEHGGWKAKYITTAPAVGWTKADFNDNSWLDSLGGFGRQEYDYFANVRFTHAKIRARKTAWTTNKIYIRRKFNLTKLPEKIALKHWVFADANFYINGNKLTVNANNNTYSTQQLDPSWFVEGENIIAVEATSPCSDNQCQQFIDFGLYDTGVNDAEEVVIGPGQPNYVTGPNGFERWLMYKAYFNNKQVQGIDRIHFYGKEMVVEGSTVKNTNAYRPQPAMPSMINYFDAPVYAPFECLKESKWIISGGGLSPVDGSGGELLLRRQEETNYRFAVPFKINQLNGWAGVYACYKDASNWLKIIIAGNNTWKIEKCVDGNVIIQTKDLPEKFAFLENNPLVSHYETPWHQLIVYKNGGRFRVELDYFNLTQEELIETPFVEAGSVGLIASGNNVSFDAVQYTMGWDEYDDLISGWKNKSGTWSTTENGLIQSSQTGKSESFKGDPAWNYEFSTYLKNEHLPSAGEAGFYPLYINEKDYVKATINYATETFDIKGKSAGNDIAAQSLSLKKRVLRYYSVSEYPTNSYRYDFRNESLISGVNILWFEGNYPYLNQTFDLPTAVKFYALQNESWVLLDTQLDGNLRFSDMNYFHFSAIKTKAIRMDVVNYPGKSSRAFSAYFDEDLSAGYFLRCRREEDGLHLFVDDVYMANVKGDWGKSQVGLVSENLGASYNGMMFYQSGSIPVSAIAIDQATCGIGQSLKLNVTIQPLNATNQNLYWESSDPAVVSVTQDGVITRHASGYARVTANATDGGTVNGTVEVLETGISSQNGLLGFFIYPSPAQDVLNYSLSEPIKEFSIYSLIGEKVTDHIPDGSNKVNLKTLSSGVYLALVRTEKETFTKSFSVLKK